MNPAPNLVLVGPMGSGKTSIGRRLADRFGLRFVDADHHVEQQSGATISAIFEHVGEAGFRQREAAALAGLLAGERLLVATGGGAVLGEANRRLMRERLRGLPAGRAGVPAQAPAPGSLAPLAAAPGSRAGAARRPKASCRTGR